MNQKHHSFALVFWGLFVLSLAICGAGGYLAWAGSGYALLSAGCVSVVGTLLVWVMSMRLAGPDLSSAVEPQVREVTERLDKMLASIEQIAEQQLISDRAKSVAFREKDRDAFRRAIHEDMAKQDFEAALALVDEMDRSFGYRAEAQRMRQEVIGRRDEAIKRQLDTAISVVERHVQAEQWQAAFKEAERLRAIFPTQPAVTNLLRDIEMRRTNVKNDLMSQWKNHVSAHRTDEAISILKKLDAYLTSTEATALEAEARSVFKEKLGKLRSEFAQAVQDNRLRDAVRLGESIISDFPNSQMAAELKESMPAIRERLDEEQMVGS